jgi:hypothetical protein
MLASTPSSTAGLLGSITLRSHQMAAADRLRAAIAEFGGGLLCDQVGMGKTFVALALCDDQACVVAPAVLKDMWRTAAESAGRRLEFVSTESLSRNRNHSSASDSLVIVDEAHHFRNPRTRRYAALAKLVANRSVVMLTATPVHNHRQDLEAILSLFLGSGSGSLTQSEVSRLIVRREIDAVEESSGIPLIEPAVWCDLDSDDDLPRIILDLPPPLPPRDGGDGGALVIHSLLRQWSSSDAALERALVRRLQRSLAMVSALESGTYPSKGELSAWASADNCVQLAFAELVATASSSTEDLLPVVRKHCDAISSALDAVRMRGSLDPERVKVIREVRQRHSGVRIVAFSQYEDTIDALFRDLSPDGHVAALTGKGARVSGGRISRREAIGRFAPNAAGVQPPRAAEAVTLLLTTDLLSEGVNLQDAGVVIHLDLPWTPARMEQRLGRVARMGSQHERVFSYVIRPPASTETLIHLERVLRDKVRESSQIVDAFPSLSLTGEQRNLDNTPRVSEAISSIFANWSSHALDADIGLPCLASVVAPNDGFLALCEADEAPALVAGSQEGLSADPARVLQVMRLCEGDSTAVDRDVVGRAIASVQRYFEGARVTGGVRTSASAHAKRAGLKRITRIVSRARPHDRARIASLASRARMSLMSRISADGERRLEVLSGQSMPDDRWMDEVAQIGVKRSSHGGDVRVLAMIVLVRKRKP